ncbi:hypothetical protein F0P96_02090 [Hymenobacter busanensis]|uniref:Uncharacterized protein n=1 Tax=Hymenobacter busanensis TaxID=2607656 RepID=A0A7L4ZTS6_9BACT|nr:hypothetical protein [Hymenobacter busanensis]KAA9339433.1 hypothetical protein F0P96_02090 [Hymenobacter busanensis]QHJ06809.1 hypothetical protein GUY19_05660 [Hymenobacter busanensis]
MPYRFHVGFWSLLLLLLTAPQAGSAQSATAAQNKQLYDRAVDEINFRTMETVYDKLFTRRKFPVTLRTAKARRGFTDFPGRDDIKKLFLNYNGVAERYKNRFGKGRTDLEEFDRQLNSILVDANFEFFIRVLPRDERADLIHSLQRYIKQAGAQYNASEDKVTEELLADGAAVPPADVDAQPEEPITKPAEEAPEQPEAAAPDDLATPAAPQTRSLGEYNAPTHHDWLDYTLLLSSVASLALVLYLTLSVIPSLRTQINNLTAEPEEEELAAETPTAKQRAPAGLPADRYEDDEA